MKNNLKFVFFGTPEVASKTLEILKTNGYLPSLIITAPDRPQGRKMIITPPPVKVWAEENNIPYLQPEKINAEFEKHMSDMWEWQLFVVVAYGKILPKELINMPKLGTINIHYSLLPKYRGASPVETSLLNGDTETGVSIQQMEYELDSGPIIAEEKVGIDLNDTKKILLEQLTKIGGNLLCKILPDLIEQKITPIPQNSNQATFCKKIKKEDGLIDFDDDPLVNYNKYRAHFGWPGTYFFKNDKRIKVTRARYESGQFIIEKVVPEGKKEINYSDFLKNN